MDANSFISNTTNPVAYHSNWEAPSNIALIKYWGKKAPQIPNNTSLSFTLTKSVTQTEVTFKPVLSGNFDFSFYFDGALKSEFNDKIQTFFKRIEIYIPWIKQYKLIIKSQNSFPHSSGIASSASSMAALSLNLMDLERHLFPKMEESFFYQKASFLARLGSGSASRSIQGPVMLWGKNDTFSFCSDQYALPFGEDLHPVFKKFQDAILIVDKGSKVVSSTQGHYLMQSHPFAANRFLQAASNLEFLAPAMRAGDLDVFMSIVELEALSLHAMMMTSSPYFILMKPNTLAIIEKIWTFRATKKVPLCFTLDAGANLHLLYPMEFKKTVNSFIQQELAVFCQNGQYILDHVGLGAKKV
tara:strand:- start:899 stop:1969 length:1071 start_codon:yes stop_codon:yes gene_type:complete